MTGFASPQHIHLLQRGVSGWNRWRAEEPNTRAMLEGIDLAGRDLAGCNLSNVNLARADLRGAKLNEAKLCMSALLDANLAQADLTGADLSDAHLIRAFLAGATLVNAHALAGPVNLADARLNLADLSHVQLPYANLLHADLSGANLTGATFTEARLSEAILTDAFAEGAVGVDLRRANLQQATCIRTVLPNTNFSEADLSEANFLQGNLSGAVFSEANLEYTRFIHVSLARTVFTKCRVYGMAAWDVNLDDATQDECIITPRGNTPTVTVDNLDVAQFLYLILSNRKLTRVIDSATTKLVLILGRFTKPRKRVLDAIRDRLRDRDYIPIIFDFAQPRSRNLAETASALAHLARFIVADVTDSRSIPLELERIVHILRSVPVQPLLHARSRPFALFESIQMEQNVLPVYRYQSLRQVVDETDEHIIAPAEAMVRVLRIGR